MVTFEEAKRIAKKQEPKVNACYEFEGYYDFYELTGEAPSKFEHPEFGREILIMKIDGSCSFVMDGPHFLDTPEKHWPVSMDTGLSIGEKEVQK